MKYLRIKNWEAFQHYKDRNPPWIKLHRALLDDYEFAALEDAVKGQLMLMWLFASQNEGRIPHDAKFLERKLGLTEKCRLDELVTSGFLISDAEAPEPSEKWPTRHIPKSVRDEVMTRDMYQCVDCKSTENLEIDHVLPVSRGGESVLENLAVRCRSCNRSKRTRTPEEQAEHLATQSRSEPLRSDVALARSREESQRRKATETEAREAFENFWAAWPRKVARSDAEKAWRKVASADIPAVMSGLAKAVVCEQWRKDGGQFIPHAATWLNGRRWEDQIQAQSGFSDLDTWMAQSGHGGMQ